MTCLEKDDDPFPGDGETFIAWVRRRFGLKRAFEIVFLVGGTRMWVPLKRNDCSQTPFQRLDADFGDLLISIYGGSEIAVPTSLFTSKELQDAILACIDLGMDDNDIAMHLHCSSRAVRSVRTRCSSKLIADAARRLGLSRDHFTSYREDLQS